MLPEVEVFRLILGSMSVFNGVLPSYVVRQSAQMSLTLDI